jgi:hypothetical protein
MTELDLELIAGFQALLGGVGLADEADITLEHLLLVIVGDLLYLALRRKPPAETLTLLRQVRVAQLLQLDVERP